MLEAPHTIFLVHLNQLNVFILPLLVSITTSILPHLEKTNFI